MSIILGYLCLLCFLMLLVKAVTRKLHLKKADVFFMQAHKYISAAILVIAVLHFIFVLAYDKGTPYRCVQFLVH